MTLRPNCDKEQLIIPQPEPFLANRPLPFKEVFYPLGFPVEILTNSPAILEAASQSWAMFQLRFEYPPLRLHLGVTADFDESSDLPPAPSCRAERHLVSHVVDAHNFVHCDLETGFAFGWVTWRTAQSTLYLRYYIIEAAVLCMLGSLRATPLHAACVSPHGVGMLLCGDSGAGKSSLAFAGARSGWTFTCDDSSHLLLGCNDRLVVGNCHQFRLRDSGPQLFPELEGRAVTPRAAGKPSVEIPTADLPDLTRSETAVVQSIVFLNRHNVKTPELAVTSDDTAQTWLRQHEFLHSPLLEERKAAISHLLKAPLYELRYTDLEWAIDRLNTLAVTGR